jgi:CelD/BcsL family acetyltransferase involved in cellulose biosynthesis
MDCLGPTWRSLYIRQDCTFFQSFEWNRLAARAFVATEEPYVVMVSSDSGAAIVPAAIADNGTRIVLLGETLFDYRDVLTGGDDDPLRGAWGELAKLELAKLELAKPGSPMSVTAVRNSALPHWHGLGVIPFTRAPQVRRAESSAEEFEARHRRLGRLFRRCERAGVKVGHCDGRESKFLRWIYEQKALQLAGKRNNLFASERRIEFLVAAAAMSPRRCEIFTFESGSKVVAALVTFRDRKVRRFYTTYYDQDWAHHSPGQLLTYEVTRRSLASGLDCDYMTGEQQHKTRLATSSVPLYRVEATTEMLQRAAEEPPTEERAA